MSATNRGRKRNKNDFYPTPGWCVDELLSELKPVTLHSFCEPCRANGQIFDRVNAKRKLWAELSDGRDYLKRQYGVQAIITNPPFSLAQEFLEKSLREAQFVAYLLRVNFIGSQRRFEFWQGNEPTHLFGLSRRPDFSGGGDACEYAWFVWDYLDLCIRRPGLYAIWNTRGKAA